MNRAIRTMIIAAAGWALVRPALATNGDNLIAVGPNARAMGGTGIAYPLDAISAVFGNPAAMCFGPYCPASEFDFAATAFIPRVDASLSIGGVSYNADSHTHIYPIPAIGLSVPIGKSQKWRFGLAAYGVSGLGVDYRNTPLDNSQFYDFGPAGKLPLIAGEFTSLQIMKFAPAIAYQPSPQWSVGLALHADYAVLDLNSGSSPNFSVGVQPGVMWQPTDRLTIGASYISPQPVTHRDVLNFGGDYSTLKLEAPHQVGVGIAYELLEKRLVIEVDGHWINWSGAQGYEDFDWSDQWVAAVGVQLAIVPDRFFVRAGYNYGSNPVEEHNGWNGAMTPLGPADVVNVQGTMFPRYYYETFRIIGFPAIVEHHVTVGLSYEFSPKFAVSISYMYAFENGITERGTDLMGQPTRLESNLSEHGVDLGLAWRF